MILCAKGSTKTPTEQVAKKKDVKKYGMPLPLHVGEQRLPDALEAFFKGEPERKRGASYFSSGAGSTLCTLPDTTAAKCQRPSPSC